MKRLSELLILVALAVVCSVGASSCVTSGDLRNLEIAQANYEHEFIQAMQQLRAGTITQEEFEERTREDRRELSGEFAQVVGDVEERTATMIEGLKGLPSDPLSLLLYLGSAAGTVAASVKGTNVVRDRRRRKGTDVQKTS